MGTGAFIRAWGVVAILGVLLQGCHEPNRIRGVEARAVLSASEVDFGEVPVGEWRDGEVRIRNVGYVPFRPGEILKLEGNPSFEAEVLDDSLIAAGEERPVRLRFHPLSEGELTETIEVKADAEHPPQTPVRLRGTGVPTRIQVEPAVVDFQTLEIESDRVLTFTVTNPVDVPLSMRLTGVFTDPFSVDLITIPPNATQTIQARYAPMVPAQDQAFVEIRSCDTCTPTQVTTVGKAVKSAFAFDPAPVPFDDIPVHERTRSKTRMTNITWRPVTVGELSTTDVSFTPLTHLAGTVVQPGTAVEVELEYAARYSGPAVAQMDVAYESNKARKGDVILDARGGRPQLAIAPASIDFGTVLIGSKVERVVRLSNAGTTGNLRFTGVRGDGVLAGQFGVSPPYRDTTEYPWDPATAWPSLRQPGAGVEIAPGTDYLDVKVYFEPTQEGDLQAEVVFLSDDMFSPERRMLVTGRGEATGPCSFKVTPEPALDFGNVPTGRGAVLGFRFENTGLNPCTVKEIHLSNTANGAFFMPGGALTGGVVPTGSAFSAQIAFKAPADGSYEGLLSITVNDPATPEFTLPVRAVAMSSCITAAPHFLDFGPIRYDCSTQPRTTYVSNQCPYPVEVTGVRIGAGTSRQFSVSAAPPMPQTLAPGQGFEVEVSYARNVLGQHFSPLFIDARGELVPYMVPLLAETNHEGSVRDTFIQGIDSQLDVLFVVSNTTTMKPYQDRLAAAIPGFIDRARAEGVDVRAGVTTTGLVERFSACGGGANGGEAGRLFPVDNSRPRIISSASASATANLMANLDVGVCHNLVQGLETMRAALSTPLIDHRDDPRTALPNDGNQGLVRSTARLAVVFLADEDDHSGFDPESYVQFLGAFKGPGMSHRTQAHAIVPTDAACRTAGPPGPRFTTVARQTGGQVRNVCSSGYSGLLDDLAVRSAGAQRDFRLTAPVDTAFPITVRVNGSTVDPANWTYDAAQNAIIFSGTAVPQSGQRIDVRYRALCTWVSPG